MCGLWSVVHAGSCAGLMWCDSHSFVGITFSADSRLTAGSGLYTIIKVKTRLQAPGMYQLRFFILCFPSSVRSSLPVMTVFNCFNFFFLSFFLFKSPRKLQEPQADSQRGEAVQMLHLQQGLPSDLQPDLPHAHSQRQEALHLRHLRQGLLPQLRPEETHQEAARQRVLCGLGGLQRAAELRRSALSQRERLAPELPV